MTDYPIYKVGVIGGGTMGGGIAALIARQGLPVVVKEATEESAEQALEKIFLRFQNWYDQNKIDEYRLKQLASLVEMTTKLEDLADVQIVIEALPELMEPKLELFRKLDEILPKEVIIASNTSSLPISELAAATGRPDRVAGIHFFNPPTRMALVEMVKAKQTSDKTLSILTEFVTASLQKMTICVADRPGFLVNCLLLPYLNEAILALEETTVTPEAIDAEAQAFGWPMGPFTVLDVVGLDTAWTVAQFLGKTYGTRMKVGTLFESLKALNRLGDKTGAGIYVTHGEHEPIADILWRLYPNRRSDVTAQQIFQRMMAGFLNEAARAIDDNVASKEDIELGAQAGLGCPKGGPLHIIDEMGAATLVKTLADLEGQYGERFKASPTLLDKAAKNETFFSAW